MCVGVCGRCIIEKERKKSEREKERKKERKTGIERKRERG